jgi:dTDP-4-amino-4,6-dideoxygalactose transaminase
LLQQKLTEAGIGTLIHYPVPPHLSGAYADAGFKSGAFPIAEQLSQTVLSLPMGPHLTKEHAAAAVAEVNKATNAIRK